MLKSKLHDAVIASWSELGSGHFHLEVALSGGVDSVVLLHVLHDLQQDLAFKLSAVHINHQLQSVAASWVLFCQDLCQRLNIPLRVETVEVIEQSSLGVEAAARKARYQAFAASQAELIVLAQHADDQIETALLALLRGGGLRALAAMPTLRDLNQGIRLWRPFLGISKQQVLDYAQQHNLKHIEDPSNQDTHYLRNWLRQDILPQMLAQKPELHSKILSGIEQLQQDLAILDDIQQQDWQRVSALGMIWLDELLTLSEARQAQQLLYFAKQHQLGSWKKSRLSHFLNEIKAFPNSRHQIELTQGVIYVDRGRIFAWNAKLAHQFEEIKQSFTVSAAIKPDYYAAKLANTETLVNTQVLINMRLYSVGQLEILLPASDYQALLKQIKQAKVPLFLTKKWPCWFDVNAKRVWIVHINDVLLKQIYPNIEREWSYLQPFLQKVKK